MKLLWLCCSLINLVVLMFSVIDIKQTAGQVNKPGIVFAALWFCFFAPPVTFMIMLYHLIGVKEKWDENVSKRKIG